MKKKEGNEIGTNFFSKFQFVVRLPMKNLKNLFESTFSGSDTVTFQI